MTQEALENLYTKIYRKFKRNWIRKYGRDKKKWPKAKGRGNAMWERFQDKHGVLLASDKPVSIPTKAASEWGDGKPLFKVRFTETGRLTTADAVNQQVRIWRDKFLTEGTPGIPLDLEKAGGMWIDEATQLNKEVHHIHGISEYEPYIDKTIKKILVGDPAGQREFTTFSKEAWDRNIILGSKVENYRAVTKPQHRGEFGSSHWRGSTLNDPDRFQSDFVTAKTSGASAFDTGQLPDELRLKEGVTTQGLLDELPREGPGRTVFTEGFDWTELVHDARIQAVDLAIDDPSLFKPELVGKKKVPNRRVRVGNSFFTYMDELGQTPAEAESLYNMVGGASRDIGLDDVHYLHMHEPGGLMAEAIKQDELKYLAQQRTAQKAIGRWKGLGKVAKRAGSVLPFVGAGLDAWDVQQRYDTMMNDPNEGLADWMDKLQFGLASTTLGTSFWAEPINTATGLLNLGIDVVRTGVEEDKRKEFLDLARHAGAQTVKAVGRAF